MSKPKNKRHKSGREAFADAVDKIERLMLGLEIGPNHPKVIEARAQALDVSQRLVDELKNKLHEKTRDLAETIRILKLNIAEHRIALKKGRVRKRIWPIDRSKE